MIDKAKILIVDDERRMCDSLKTLLEIEGYSILAVSDSEEAVNLINNENFDLVITDIKMPGISGLDILKRARKKDPSLEVILITGYASLSSAKEAVELGAFGYITKPIEFEDFKLKVIRSLEKRSNALEKNRLLEQLTKTNTLLKQKLSEIDALFSASTMLATAIDLTEALTQILSLAIDVIGAKIGSVMILDPTKNELYIGAACGLSDDIVLNTKLKLGSSIAGYVAKTAEPLIVEDIEKDPRFSRINRQHYESKSLISVPLRYKGRILGVINLNNKTTGTTFNEDDLKLLTSFAAQAAIAIDRANIFADRGEKINELTVLFDITRKISTIDSIEGVGEIIFNEIRKLVHIDGVIWYGLIDRANVFRADFSYLSEKYQKTLSLPTELKMNKEVIGLGQDVDIGYIKDVFLKNFAECFSSEKCAIEIVPVALRGSISGIMVIISEDELSAERKNLAAIIATQAASVYERQKAIFNGMKLVTMGKIISEICHDLKKPLTNLKGEIQVYKDRIKGLKASQFFSSSEKEINRMTELTKEMVDFANPNKYNTKKELIKPIIEKASRLLNKDFQKKNIDFTITQSDGIPEVEINKNEVFEAILNIMLNAVESMVDGGRLDVKISMHPTGDPYVQITISDTGCGIPEDKLQRIFERYYTTKESGSGLGLAIVERVISANNGRLFVESEEGKGTTFKIDLPI
ncbi:MAG: hypothetical protein B6D58_01060 [candidate division Zixibacteria bacterium 4484_95]|nr:MAG: hypothetical protein B6D58_01060 [candidate division Zixibacteria bacterium 4484_95]